MTSMSRSTGQRIGRARWTPSRKRRSTGRRSTSLAIKSPGWSATGIRTFFAVQRATRWFLGLSTDSSRHLRIIAFRPLQQIKELKEKDMPTAYLQCFFCKYDGQTTTNILLTYLRHRPLLSMEEGDPACGGISLRNLMWDDTRRVGILNDLTSPGSRIRRVRVGKTTRGTYHSWRWTRCRKRVCVGRSLVAIGAKPNVCVVPDFPILRDCGGREWQKPYRGPSSFDRVVSRLERLSPF